MGNTSTGYGMQLPEDTIIKTDEPAIDAPAQPNDPSAPEGGQPDAGTAKDNKKEAMIKAGAGVLGDALSATALLMGGSGGSKSGGNQPGASQGDVPFSSTPIKALERNSLTPDQRASLALAILSKTGGIN